MGEFEPKIQDLMNKLQRAIMEANRLQESQLRIELLRVLKDQEAFWLQRSRIQWINESDKNTIYFHKVAST